MARETKILFACSASGGHIFPALSAAQAIKASNSLSEVILLTEKNKVSSEILNKNEFEAIFVDAKLVIDFHQPLMNSIEKLLINSVKIINILRKTHPDIIVGFGGYLSIIPVLSAKFLGADCIIHEQNVVLGKANRFLAIFAQRIAVSFRATKDCFTGSKLGNKIVYTGLPLRKDLKQYDKSQASEFFKLDPHCFTLLILGGSTGSSAINRYCLETIDNLPGKENLQIIHISGAMEEASVRSFYGQRPYLKTRVFPFLKEMSFAFSLADLCVSRSGASAVYELSFFKLPSILIPYKYAGGHQLENARILSCSNAAILIEEDTVLSKLRETLGYFLKDRNKLKEMTNNFPRDLIFDAAKQLGSLIIDRHEKI